MGTHRSHMRGTLGVWRYYFQQTVSKPVEEQGEVHGPFFACPTCKRMLMTNDPPGQLGWCQKCRKGVRLENCKKQEQP